ARRHDRHGGRCDREVPHRRHVGGRGAARDDDRVTTVPSFPYRALTANGELTSGTISAASVAEVARRLEARGLFYVDDGSKEERRASSRPSLAFFNRPTPEDVTIFTRDLALLLKAGARINDALDLLSDDIDLGRLRPVVIA